MVFYYAITNYHILNCILHRLKYNKNKKSVLYISKWHPEHLILLKNIKKSKFFDEVFIFEEILFPSGNRKIMKKEIRNDIEYVSMQITKKNKIDFNLYDEINVCGDQYGLSVYLNNNHIKYNYFEDGCGILSNLSLLTDNIKKIEYSRYQILKFFNSPGSSKFILGRFGDLNAQLPNYYDKRDIHFSVKEELEKVDKLILKKIISIFDNSFVIDDYNNYDIVLTFHYNNLGILSLEEQRLFYSYLLDFFGHDKVVIKPHPSDIQGKYEEWFPNLKILPRKLPSEFLPLLVRNNFNVAITGWSTSVNGLRDKVNRIVNFDQQIDYKYIIMLKYYMIAQIIINLLGEKYNIVCCGFSINYIKNFIESFENNNNYQYYNCNSIEEIDNVFGKKIIIFDKVVDDQVEVINKFDNHSIIFEIEDINNSLLENDNLIFGIIEKRVIDARKYVNSSVLNYESFSCIVKDVALKKKLLSFKVEKNLKYVNVKSRLVFDFDKKEYILDINNRNDIINQMKNEISEKNIELLSYKDAYLKRINDLECQLTVLKENIVNKDAEIVELKNRISCIMNSNSWRITRTYRKFGGVIKIIINKILRKDDINEK